MNIKFRNDINPDILFKEINESVISIDGNAIKFNPFDFKKHIWLLKSIIIFDRPFSKSFVSDIIVKAHHRAIIEKSLTKEKFIALVENIIKEHISDMPRDFFLLGSLAIDKLPFKFLKIGTVEIRTHGTNFPRKFLNSRNHFFVKNKIQSDEKDFLKISIKIKNTNYEIAANLALRNLEVLRGIVNLLINPESQFHFPEKPRQIFNKVLSGEYWTLHNIEGDLSNDRFALYEVDYHNRKLYKITEQEYDYLNRDLRIWVNRFNKCKPNIQTNLTKALCNYVKAFDYSNSELTFINSWTVLETLTNSYKNDTILKRILGLIHKDDLPYKRLELRLLKELRNSYVHELEYENDFQLGCYSIQKYIILLIFRFHFVLAGEFSSIDEASKYLDMINGSNLELLKKRRIRNDFMRKL